jgi:hypothetical protein
VTNGDVIVAKAGWQNPLLDSPTGMGVWVQRS